MTVRVRFAPSPTGYLHVGGARTALFNWLFARNKGGKFILRIEDTDRVRSTKESLDDILDSLKWLGLDWDEGPYFQSERLAIYKEYAEKIGEYKDGAFIFKSTHEKIFIDDIVHGRIEFDTGLIDDFVILKSDGMPTYNFACVVDDALMQITHVIRGDDHISNTPKQIMIYRSLGFKEPLFAHVPMILGPDGTRLSKRHGATSVSEYRRQGYLAPALLNFLALLGWSPGEDKEILPVEEIIKRFSLERITGKSAVFNIEKLTWMNSVYISKLEDHELVSLCKPYLPDSKNLDKIVPLFKKRIKVLSDITTATDYFFKDRIEYERDAVEKFLRSKDLLVRIKKVVEGIDPFETPVIESALRGLVAELGIEPRQLMQTIRVAITGRTVSAGIFETMAGMGKEMVLKHMDQAIEIVKVGP